LAYGAMVNFEASSKLNYALMLVRQTGRRKPTSDLPVAHLRLRLGFHRDSRKAISTAL
jgi:hypothetical protein